MRKIKLLVLLVLVVTFCSLTLFGRHQGQKEFVDYVVANVYEPFIRGEATYLAMPAYPAEARNAGIQGWVDSAVGFDENGRLKRIKILESPSPSLSKAVEEAVKQWTVRVGYDSAHRPFRLLGELRFHFIIRDGVASVENPTRQEQEIRSKAFTKLMHDESHRPGNQAGFTDEQSPR